MIVTSLEFTWHELVILTAMTGHTSGTEVEKRVDQFFDPQASSYGMSTDEVRAMKDLFQRQSTGPNVHVSSVTWNKFRLALRNHTKFEPAGVVAKVLP